MNATAATAKPHILHLHSTFAPGGKELRTVQLINGFGPGLRHTIVSAESEENGAAERIHHGIAVTLQPEFPSLKGLPTPGRLHRLARAMRSYDLVLTYNWGAMDAVMAHTLFSEAYDLPPLIHHEDGFDEEELVRRMRRRTWYRRIALGKAAGLVVPSEQLEEIALVEWQQPLGRVKRIANGIDTKAFAKKPRNDAIRRLLKRPGENWVGTLAGLRKVKNLPRLVRAFAPLPDNWHLVICGEGPERAMLGHLANELGIASRVAFLGWQDDPQSIIRGADILVCPSRHEPFGNVIAEGMACGKPVISTQTNGGCELIEDGVNGLLVPVDDVDALADALAQLTRDVALAAQLAEGGRSCWQTTLSPQRVTGDWIDFLEMVAG